ncbi:Mitochondrial matrix iron chaperone [Binucleata daphniae]
MEPLQLSVPKYNEFSTKIMNTLCRILESQPFNYVLNESDGVLTYSVPTVGNYVFNKQPGNKQVWTSSPINGPKRFFMAKDMKWYDTKENMELKSYIETEMQKIKDKLNKNKV